MTLTSSATGSSTSSQTPSGTETSSASISAGASQSASLTPTHSGTGSTSPTQTLTSSATESSSTSVNAGVSQSSTMTQTPSGTDSPSSTSSLILTISATESSSESSSTTISRSASVSKHHLASASKTIPIHRPTKLVDDETTEIDTTSSYREETVSSGCKLESSWLLPLSLIKRLILFDRTEDLVNISEEIDNSEEKTIAIQESKQIKWYDKFLPSYIIKYLANTSPVIEFIDFLTNKIKELTSDCPSYYRNIDNSNTNDWIANNINNIENEPQILVNNDIGVLGANVYNHIGE